MKLLILRPQPGADATAARIEAAGHEAEIMPIFAIEAVPWTPPPGEFEGLLLTSANAVRQAGSQLGHYAHLPARAVGEKTAHAARQAGLQVVQTGIDGVEDLLGQAEPERLLWLCGEERSALPDTWRSFVETVAVYRSAPIDTPENWRERTAGCDFVLLHSARAAAHFAALAGDMRASLAIAALSPKIADAAGGGWKAVCIAREPSDAALLSSLLTPPTIEAAARQNRSEEER